MLCAAVIPTGRAGIGTINYATMALDEVDLAMSLKEKENSLETASGKYRVLHELIGRSRKGDTEAMGAIYEQFKIPLFNLAYRYTYNSAVAEDIIQDIFLKVFSHLQDLGRDEAFVGWLFRIAVNTCLSYLRSNKRLLQKTISLSEAAGTTYEKGSNHHEKVMSKPLEDAIQALSTRLKSVFLLHDVQGFKHDEIAKILGCSVGTSKSQLFKARRKIRKRLENNQVL